MIIRALNEGLSSSDRQSPTKQPFPILQGGQFAIAPHWLASRSKKISLLTPNPKLPLFPTSPSQKAGPVFKSCLRPSPLQALFILLVFRTSLTDHLPLVIEVSDQQPRTRRVFQRLFTKQQHIGRSSYQYRQNGQVSRSQGLSCRLRSLLGERDKTRKQEKRTFASALRRRGLGHPSL